MGKKALCLIFAFLLSIESFAAVVADNDGSAFITKAEFDSLKNDFQSKIDNYNRNIDYVIDEAIASYLSGLKISKTETITPFYAVYPTTTTTSGYNLNVFSVPRQKFNKNKQYKSFFNIYASKWNASGTWGSTVHSLDPYKYGSSVANGRWYFAVCNIKSNEILDQPVYVTSKDNPYRVKYRYKNGYLTCSGGMFWRQLWIGSQQSWWINYNMFNNIKLEESITTWDVDGFNSNGYNYHEDEYKTIIQDTRYDQGTIDENDLRSVSGQYGTPGGCGLIVTKVVEDVDENIYLFNVVDDEVVMYNELDDELEEYEESVYSGESMTKRQEVKATNGINLADWTDNTTSYNWYLDTAWPHFRIKQTHSGMVGSSYIRLNNLYEVENGLLTYKKQGESSLSAPGFAGGLPLFTISKDGDMEFNIKINISSDFPTMTKARLWVYDDEFPNKSIALFTNEEKQRLVKFDSNIYIDIDLNTQTKVKLKDLKEGKTYFLKFGDKNYEYGGQITYLNDFVATYKE